MRSSNIRYLPAVDHLRAYAALLIVFYHGLHVFAYRLRFGAETLSAAWTTAVNEGAAAAARLLRAAGVEVRAARSLSRALADSRRLTRIEASRRPAGAVEPAVLGTITLVEGPDGVWALTLESPATDWVDARPLDAREVVVLNAGAAIWLGGGADGLGHGIERARSSLDSGAAREVLAELVELTGRLGGDGGG